MTLMTLSMTAKIATPPMVPQIEPRPPESRVPPSTTAAIESRSYPPWLPTVGLPTPRRLASSRPASAAVTEHSTCAMMTDRAVRRPERRATAGLPPTA